MTVLCRDCGKSLYEYLGKWFACSELIGVDASCRDTGDLHHLPRAVDLARIRHADAQTALHEAEHAAREAEKAYSRALGECVTDFKKLHWHYPADPCTQACKERGIAR